MVGLKRVKEDTYNGTSLWAFCTRDEKTFYMYKTFMVYGSLTDLLETKI